MTQIDLSKFESEIIIRTIKDEDIDEIVEIAQIGFGNPDIAFKRKHYESHIKIFPEGQICIEYNGKIIGSSGSLIVNFDEYDNNHTMDEISGNGYITNHNPNGLNLYGIDVVVHPDYRYMKIGRRLYEERRRICKRFNLKSIIFGGRIPNYHKYADQMTAIEYAEQVRLQKIYDPVLTFQLMNGFELKGVNADYLKEDAASLKYATLMEWNNVDYVPESRQYYQHAKPVRIASIQYKLRNIKSFEEFATQCEYFIDQCSKKRSDFAILPESLTLQLLSFLEEKVPSKQVRLLTEYTEKYIRLFSDLAVRYSINIVGGSHFVEEEDGIHNIAFHFHRNGKIDKQYKLHIPIDERKWWGIQPGNEVNVFNTDCGKVAIVLGYDIQFPEVSRMAVDKGAEIIFTPFNSEDQQGYLRVRYCAQARAIENQVYTVIVGMVGNLTNIYHMNTNYAESAILTPSDYSFPANGIVAKCGANIETIIYGEVDIETLRRNRLVGTVTPLKDRRLRIYNSKK